MMIHFLTTKDKMWRAFDVKITNWLHNAKFFFRII